MRQKRDSALTSFRRLLRFFLVYGLALLVLFRVFPVVARFAQDVYDGLDAITRFILVSSLLAVAITWQLIHLHRQRSHTQTRR